MKIKSKELSSQLAPHPGGFTMIEMVGVLALVAILAVVMLPSVIKQVDQAAWTRETSDLKEIGEALERSIVRTKTVPNVAGIAAAVAEEMALPVNAITTTPRGRARAFLMDPSLRIDGLAPGALPYEQDEEGASAPVSARVLIVSSLMDALPVTSGVPTQAAFNNIWDAGENEVPTGWAWTGRGEDLRIRRINLGPKFHRLMLLNRVNESISVENRPQYSVEDSSLERIDFGPANAINRFFIDSTVVGLHDENGDMHTRYLQDRDISFVFERGRWQGWIGPGSPFYDESDEFVAEAVAFLGADWNDQASKGASQTGVLVAMYVFMFNYALWAEQCPAFSKHGLGDTGNPQNVAEWLILRSIGNPLNGVLAVASEELLNYSNKPPK
jgi:prepilin-type N-terminal cleavage/methylation domain-containing protein